VLLKLEIVWQVYRKLGDPAPKRQGAGAVQNLADFLGFLVFSRQSDKGICQAREHETKRKPALMYVLWSFLALISGLTPRLVLF
jgi:hypothetical protein